MGNSCSSNVHRSVESNAIGEKKHVLRRGTPKSKEVRLIVSPWKPPYESPYMYSEDEEEAYGVSKPRYSWGPETLDREVEESKPRYSWGPETLDREVEEERSKIDGLCGSDLVSFYGLRRKDILNFLERSLSEKEKTCTRGIRRVERRPSRFGWTSGPDNLCMHIVTWNMNGKLACHELHQLLGGKGESFDFYVIGLQEVPNLDAGSVILDALGRNYSLIANSVMLSLQLFIFARNASKPFITEVRVDKVGLGGLGGVVRRQKGAVAITLIYKGCSFLFIACHLSAHENNVLERNVQYQRICQTIFNKPKTSSFRQSPNQLMDLSGCRMQADDDQDQSASLHSASLRQSDVVVWLGDLNYRIEGSRKSVSLLIRQNLQKLLRAKDQLSREAEKGEIFHGFCEGPLSFRPTYKYDIGTDDYDTSAKERVPSWTDRILYRVSTSATNIKVHVQDYDSIETVKASDHRPVKALLKINLCSSTQPRIP